MGVSIASLGYYLPKNKVNNEELLRLIANDSECNQDDFDILRKKLILNKADTRYFRNGEEDGLYMAENAALRCIRRSNLKPEDLDLVIYGAMHRDYLEPAMSVILHRRLGAVNANAFDVSNACNSFMNMIEIAHNFIELGKYHNILLVGTELGSDWIPWESFGNDKQAMGFSALTVSDGAAAMILSEDKSNKNFKLFNFETYSQHHELCQIKIGKRAEDLKLIVQSRQLAMAAMDILPKYVPRFVNAACDYLGGLDILFLHQVTGVLRKLCGSLSDELYAKAYNTFSTLGNTGSISVPLAMALAEEEGKLKRGDRVAAVVGASGLSCGGTAFIY